MGKNSFFLPFLKTAYTIIGTDTSIEDSNIISNVLLKILLTEFFLFIWLVRLLALLPLLTYCARLW
jgi:hypothetical protein